VRGTLSCYLLPGRTTRPGDVIAQAQDAEAVGFDGVWISERLDLKEIGVLVGAAIAATSRVRVGVGVTHLGTRNVMTLSALAATAQTMSTGRFSLGLGRGMPGVEHRLGIPRSTLAGLETYPQLLRQLWRGERVTHHGDLGDIERARFTDAPSQPCVPLYLATIGDQGFAAAARAFDGVILHPLLTPEAVESCVEAIRAAETRAGTADPVRIIATVLTSPDLDDATTNEIVQARALTYLQLTGLGDRLVARNNWNPAQLTQVREALSAIGGRRFVDMNMTRRQLAGLASLVPAAWVEESCAVGSSADCAKTLEQYWAAGADEVLVHSALPAQCHALLSELGS
jgi:5,10-methylenetetrahydromethanopterin reductase